MHSHLLCRYNKNNECTYYHHHPSHSITKLGHGGLFHSQHSLHLELSLVVVQVVVFLLDDILEVI
jgi:hypothetical protein